MSSSIPADLFGRLSILTDAAQDALNLLNTSCLHDKPVCTELHIALDDWRKYLKGLEYGESGQASRRF
jgi:hypothetical protein